MVLASLVAALGLLPAAARPQPIICVTDPAGWYRDSPEKIDRRFTLYRSIGVEMLRVEIDWRSCEPEAGKWDAGYIKAYLQLARKHGFRLKMIIGDMMAPPRWFLDATPASRIIDETGKFSTNTMSYWYPGLMPLLAQKQKQLIASLREMGVLDLVDYVVPTFGPAGEPLYPVPWTLGMDVPQTYWCYSDEAQSSFRDAMKRRHRTAAAADRAWGTRFGDWQQVRVLQPGERPGAYWADVLTWYRDTKRVFLRKQIANLKRQVGARTRLLMYIPGTAYTPGQWDEAVATARGSDPIMMMADSFDLIDAAASTGCQLQYTGCENEPEVARLAAYLTEKGYSAIPLWGENAGVLGAARDPQHLADVILKHQLAGIDYTHAHFLFEPDGVTPNDVFPRFAAAIKRIKAQAR